ncbi:MAG: DUF5801 repeats-in-toxin domain-containing protein, partial [Vulcanococcus sp.]
MAKERGADGNEVRSISNGLNNRLRRLLGLENLHDGGREQRDDVSESIPEGARPVHGETLPGEAMGAAGLADAPLGREWNHGFEAMPIPSEAGQTGGGNADVGAVALGGGDQEIGQLNSGGSTPAQRTVAGSSNTGGGGVDSGGGSQQGGTGKGASSAGGKTATPDGVPTLGLTGGDQELTVDETDLKSDAIANFSKLFNVNYGPDGKGSGGIRYEFAISKPGVDSGLIDTATGEHVLLFMGQSGNVMGITPSGLNVFDLELRPDGTAKLDQLRPVIHPDSQSPDESFTLANQGLIQLTGTVTDANGSKASATIAIGQMLHFKDDGPSLELNEGANKPIIQVDESFIGHAGASNSANFSSAFSASHNAGQDGELSFSSSYQLLTSDGTDSGLIDSDSGKHILLYTDPSGHVFGRVDGPSGDKALDISVDQNGVVSFSTLRAVQHPDSANPDEPKSLAPRSLVLQRTDTVVDKDGDSASGKASVDLGSALSIKDDAPTL